MATRERVDDTAPDGVPRLVTEKRCPRCGRWLPTRRFARNRANRDGLAGWCKRCSRSGNTARGRRRVAALRAYRAAHGEVLRALDRARYWADPAASRARKRDEKRRQRARGRAA